jgi:hypothetical protein
VLRQVLVRGRPQVVHVPVPDQQCPQRRHAIPLAAAFGVFLGGDEPLVLGK